LWYLRAAGCSRLVVRRLNHALILPSSESNTMIDSSMWYQIPIRNVFYSQSRTKDVMGTKRTHAQRVSLDVRRSYGCELQLCGWHHNIATGGNYERPNLTNRRLGVALFITTPTKFVHERNFERPSCSKCGNLILVPEESDCAGDGCIRHRWLCDDCDYRFRSLLKVRI
jgi:hypothetical protein